MNDDNLIVKKNKRITKIKKSLKKYEEDLFNYQNATEDIKEKDKEQKTLKDVNNEFVTVEEDSEEEIIKKPITFSTTTVSQTKNLNLFSHSYLNEQKTHIKSIEHPQKIYHSMKVRK